MSEKDTLSVRPDRIALYLLAMTGVLGLAHVLLVYLRRVHGMDYVRGLAPLFDFVQENNFPSYFSALLLLLAAALLAIVAFTLNQQRRRQRVYWIVLALIFAFLSCDEMFALHERLMEPTRRTWNLSGLLYAAWIVPYMIVLLCLAVVYFRWFMALSSITRWRFFLAAVLFLSGAVFVEALSGAEWETHGSRTFRLDVYIFLEDILEMTGVIVFIHALTSELRYAGVRIGFGD